MVGRLRFLAGSATPSLVLVALLLAGCGDTPTSVPPPPPPPPGPTPSEGLSFLRFAQTAPALQTTDTTFVATRGQSHKIEFRYVPVPPEDSGEKFLEFELDQRSLLRYPPGHPRAGVLFADGDTITIRIQVDPAKLIVTLTPSGIQFDPAEPAELEIRYGNADDDYDEDGASDPAENEARIDLWRQENPGDPWTPIGEIKDRELNRIRAKLTSFSRYALAI